MPEATRRSSPFSDERGIPRLRAEKHYMQKCIATIQLYILHFKRFLMNQTGARQRLIFLVKQ